MAIFLFDMSQEYCKRFYIHTYTYIFLSMSYSQSFHRLIETENIAHDLYYVIRVYTYFSYCIFLIYLSYLFHAWSYIHRFRLIQLIILLSWDPIFFSFFSFHFNIFLSHRNTWSQIKCLTRQSFIFTFIYGYTCE